MQSQGPGMAFSDTAMERRKSFLKALQELKNLKPQLYSAAEYSEKSYIYNDQKQMVLDSLKDYSMKALVNTVDHLGTIAYKLTEIFEQQSSNVSTLDLKLTCLDQRLQMCQSYINKEGLRQQQLSVATPEHHNHYVLLGPLNTRLQASEKVSRAGAENALGKPRSGDPGIPPSKTLLWHLASEVKSDSNDASVSSASTEDTIGSAISPGTFCLSDAKAAVSSIPASAKSGLSSTDTGAALVHARRSSREIYKTLSTYKSFNHGGQRQTNRTLVRSKSMLSAIFGKSKSGKFKIGHPF